MDKYHRSNPPTELKSVVLGRKNSRKGASYPAPRYRLLDTDDIIRSDDEFLEDDAEHWSQIDLDHSWNAGHKWHSGLKPMRRIIQR